MKKPFPEQELIFSKTNEATIDLVFEIWMYKKLLSDYFPSTNRTLPETQFYTLMMYSKTSNRGFEIVTLLAGRNKNLWWANR